MPGTEDREANTARELPPGAIIPKHGKGMLQPWKPGQSGRPGGLLRTDDYIMCVRACQKLSPESVEKVVHLMRTSTDERVQYMTATWIVERAFGKPKEYDPNAAREHGASVDVANLTPAELETLLAITRRGAVTQPSADPNLSDPPTVDGVSTPVSTPPTSKSKRRK